MKYCATQVQHRFIPVTSMDVFPLNLPLWEGLYTSFKLQQNLKLTINLLQQTLGCDEPPGDTVGGVW